ncbi:MAG: WecB/TagA/CpsF family glycosyltransferase [Planctomycetota bacterium]
MAIPRQQTLPRPAFGVASPTLLESGRLPQIPLGEVRVHAIRQSECVAHVMRALDRRTGGSIATVNLDHWRRLRTDAAFRAAYRDASLVVADGMPLVWASRLQGTPLPERVAGSDLIFSLTRAAAEHDHGVFLLGGNPGTAEIAAQRLAEQAPGLRVVGTHCPQRGFEQDPAQLAAVRELVARSGAGIVFVALGSPKQELFIHAQRSALPQAWWIGVGISFSFVAGEVRRAPLWVQRHGLEWLHRLLQDPARLWTRYLWHGPWSAARLFAQALWRRVRPLAPEPTAMAPDSGSMSPP